MKKLMLGVARNDITPKVGGLLFGYTLDFHSSAINDNLHITALSFKYGETKVMFLNATVCVIGVTYCDEIRRKISSELGIPFENIIISVIHTHSGPSLAEEADGWYFDKEYYEEIFCPAAIAAALEADKSVEPVTVGFACGNCYAGINRRELTLENGVCLGQNPWGPFNAEMNVISFKNCSQKIVANIITYGAHATAAGLNKEVTRDWPGVMNDAIEQLSGGLTVFFNGTMGDSGPRLASGGTTGTGISSVFEIGNIAAKDATRIFDSIQEYKDVSLSVSSGNLELPLKPLIPYNEVVDMIEKLENENSGNLFDAHLDTHTIRFYTKTKEAHEKGYEENKFKEIPQTVVRIGDIAFAPFTFEMFAEVAFRINRATPDLKVIAMSYANGQMLYLPTEDQICRGGHEVRCFMYSNVPQYAENSDYYLVTGTLKNIEKLER